jgi:hypothetical protein
MTNCPRCTQQLPDGDYCSRCGWLSPALLELHERLTRTAAVVRLYDEKPRATWVTPPEPVMVTLAPRTPRPGRDAKVIRQGVLKQ